MARNKVTVREISFTAGERRWRFDSPAREVHAVLTTGSYKIALTIGTRSVELSPRVAQELYSVLSKLANQDFALTEKQLPSKTVPKRERVLDPDPVTRTLSGLLFGTAETQSTELTATTRGWWRTDTTRA